MRRPAELVMWMLMTASISFAQEQSTDTSLVPTTPGNCETNASDLNTVAKDELSRDGVVIAIARLGNKETSRIHNRRRLVAVDHGLVKSGLPAQRVITAEGERVEGYGRVELYAAGKLRMVILANPNKGLCVECCDAPVSDLRRGRKRRR